MYGPKVRDNARKDDSASQSLSQNKPLEGDQHTKWKATALKEFIFR